MKSAVVATVFTYLIGALAAPMGAEVAPSANDALALRAVMNGEVAMSAEDTKLVNGLLAALAKRDDAPSAASEPPSDPTPPTSTASSDPTPASSATAAPTAGGAGNLGGQIGDILDKVDKLTGGQAFKNIPPGDLEKLTAILKSLQNSHQILGTAMNKREENAVAVKQVAANVVALFKEAGASDADIHKMYANGLVDGIIGAVLGPLSGVLKNVPLVGGLLGDGAKVPGAGGLGGLGDALGGLTGAVGGITKGATDAVKGATDAVKGAADGALDAVGNATGGIPGVKGVTDAVKGAADSATGAAAGAVNGAANLVNSAGGGPAPGVAKRDEQGLIDALSSVVNQVPALGPILAQVLETAGGVTKGVASSVPVVGGVAHGVLKRDEQGIVDALSSVVNQVPALGPILAQVLETAGGVTKGVASSVPVVGGVAHGVLKRDEQGLVDALSTIIKQVPALGPILGQVLDTAGGVTKGVVSSVPAVGGVASTVLKRDVDGHADAFNKMLKDMNMDENEFFTLFEDRMNQIVQMTR